MLPAAHRLRRSADIKRLYREGQRWQHPLLILFADANHEQLSRFAVSVSGRVGNAVVRNHCKRRIREVVRSQIPNIEKGWDCLFVARGTLPGATYGEIERAVNQLLRRARLIRGDG